MKALQESIKQMSENTTALNSEKLSENYKSQFVSEMDKLKIPASFYNTVIMGRELNSAEQTEELVSSVKTGYTKHVNNIWLKHDLRAHYHPKMEAPQKRKKKRLQKP